MRRLVSIIDPETNELVEPAEYTRRLARRRDRCRIGSPVVIADWPEPVKSPLDGSIMRSRADLREQEIKHDVKCCGDAGYLEGLKPAGYKPQSRKKELYDLIHENRPVPEKVKALMEGRLDTPPPVKPLET